MKKLTTMIWAMCFVGCVSAPLPPPVVVPPAPITLSPIYKANCDIAHPTGPGSPLCYAAAFMHMNFVSNPGGAILTYATIGTAEIAANTAILANDSATARIQLNIALAAVKTLPTTPDTTAAIAAFTLALAWLP